MDKQTLSDTVPSPTPAGWHAELRLGYERRGDATVLAERRRRGPLALQRSFYPEGGVCHNYLLHPPGGLVGGDRVQVEVELGPGAHALVTTPGAAKLYRSAGPAATVQQTLQLAPTATLEWLPQENILFRDARAAMRTEVRLADDSRFFGWELHCLGRPASGEVFDRGQADLRLALYRGGRPLLVERLSVGPDRRLGGAAGLRGYPVTGTLLATPADTEHLALARQVLDAADSGPAAATLVDGILVTRCLGNDSGKLGELLRAIWRRLRGPWIGLPACSPRIWAT